MQIIFCSPHPVSVLFKCQEYTAVFHVLSCFAVSQEPPPPLSAVPKVKEHYGSLSPRTTQLIINTSFSPTWVVWDRGTVKRWAQKGQLGSPVLVSILTTSKAPGRLCLTSAVFASEQTMTHDVHCPSWTAREFSEESSTIFQDRTEPTVETTRPGDTFTCLSVYCSQRCPKSILGLYRICCLSWDYYNFWLFTGVKHS